MTPEQFAYWLQGFAELNPTTPPTVEQWKSICEHLSTVFVKVTPPLTTTPRPNILPPTPAIEPHDNWKLPKDWPPQKVTCQDNPISYC